jgi:hypothetical protein
MAQVEGSGTTAAAPSESCVVSLPNRPIKADQSDYDGKWSHERPSQRRANGERAGDNPNAKGMIPTEIKSESAVSMIGPLRLAGHAIEQTSFVRPRSDRF